jgi:hypothetical protein
MSKYVTKQYFGGQRASVGRVVVLATDKHDGKPGICLRAGVIRAISSSKDMPYIAAHDSLNLPTTVDHVSPGDHEWKFVETRTEAEVEAMLIGSWTWPVRV